MGTFRIVTPQDVQLKMALPNIEAALPIIETAIDSAQLRMETELGTKFDRGSCTEVFNCDPTLHNAVPDGYFRLRLSRGFVTNDIVVTCGDEDITAECIVKFERGYVFVPEDIATDMQVAVAYTFGFTENDPVPAWLKEAVLSYVPAAFYMGNPDVRADSSSVQVINLASQHALSVIAPYSRKMNFATPPMFPVEDDPVT